jgi:tetratricopeptide (TPR) repeat protein
LLSEVQERAGRLPEACDTARRALELAESRQRRRQAESLARRLRQIPADAAAAAALERALSVLDPAATQPEPEPDGPTLAAEAQDRLDQGDAAGARERFLAAAAVHRKAGELNAALDACYLALAIAPADPELHLALAELYLDRGWRGPAAEKLTLLDRLVSLEDGSPVRERIRALASERLGDVAGLAPLEA